MHSIRVLPVLVALAAIPALALGAGSKPTKPATSIPEAQKLFADGVAAMEAKSWPVAEKAFRRVLELEPELAVAHNNLGYCLRKSGAEHHDEALRHYNRALELDPELAAALHYRGVLHVLAGREAEAKADHQRLVALDPNLAGRLLEVIASGIEGEHNDGVASW